MTATLKLLQERGETLRDTLVGGIVLGPEPLPDFPQPWRSGQDVATFGPRAGYNRLMRFAGSPHMRSTPEHEAPTSAQNVCESLRDK